MPPLAARGSVTLDLDAFDWWLEDPDVPGRMNYL
jgi:hypothetical protein